MLFRSNYAANQHSAENDVDQVEACLRGRGREGGDGTVALHGVIPLQLSCLSFRATPSPLRERLQPRALERSSRSEKLAAEAAPTRAEFFHPSSDRTGQVVDRDQHGQDRSEEHTSELQSLMRISYAVFCLKKKIKKKP